MCVGGGGWDHIFYTTYNDNFQSLNSEELYRGYVSPDPEHPTEHTSAAT